jgi:predicted Zn-dependent peptidase
MSSRLFTNLRGKNGLAYYVKTDAEAYLDAGYLSTQVGVPRDKAVKAIEIILNEYKLLTTDLVAKKELARAKDLLQGRLFLQMEASDSLANWYARQSLFRNDILKPEKFLAQMKAVTPKDIQRVAKKIFINQNLNLAVIGKIRDEKKLKKILHI